MTSYELANALRSTDSRSKRALLDEAADCIQRLDTWCWMLEEAQETEGGFDSAPCPA